MTSPGEAHQPAARIFRAREGRLLGGVCAGLPDFWGLGTTGLRLLFVVTALLGGIGIVIYLACWLVVPAADQDPDPVRSVVLLAWTTGGLVVIVLVAAAAALATVFGLGWVVFGVAAAVLAASFSPLWARIPQAVALVTVAALTLPAVAVALSPLHLALQPGDETKRPTSYTTVDRSVYRSGLGTLLIDLRRTPLPIGSCAQSVAPRAPARRRDQASNELYDGRSERLPQRPRHAAHRPATHAASDRKLRSVRCTSRSSQATRPSVQRAIRRSIGASTAAASARCSSTCDARRF